MGLAADRLHRVGRFVLSAGGSDESVTIFAGRIAAPAADADGIAGYAGLATSTRTSASACCRPPSAIENALAGRYANSITAMALLWFAARRDWLRQEWAHDRKLFLDDAYLRRAEARRRAVLPGGVVLDRSAFYARSGGQPGDSGHAAWAGGSAAVAEAVKGEGDTVLLPVAGAPPPVGTPVTATIDWPRRHAHMRMHTALHLLCSLLPGAAVTGGQIGAEKSRLDFDLPGRRTASDRGRPRRPDRRRPPGDHRMGGRERARHQPGPGPHPVGQAAARHRALAPGAHRAGGRPVDLQPCGGTHVAPPARSGRSACSRSRTRAGRTAASPWHSGV